MSIDHVVTAMLDTKANLKYKRSSLSHGKWKTSPQAKDTIAAGTGIGIFEAWNVGSSAQPPCGSATYYTPDDGTEFTFFFNDNMVEDNYCYSEMDKVEGPWTIPEPDYPKSGLSFVVTYKIGCTAGFLDAPVFPQQILDAPKCDLYSREKIEKFIDNRKCIYLRDVFQTKALVPEAKLWCATNPIFLTPDSKSILMGDLAKLVAGELSEKAHTFLPVLEKTAAANHSIPEGGLSKAAAQELKESIGDEYRKAKDRQSKRDCELIDTIASLLNTDLSVGLLNAASAYLGRAEREELKNRVNTFLKLVEARVLQ